MLSSCRCAPLLSFFLWSCVRTKMVKGKSALILLPSYLYYNSHHFTSLTTILFSLDFFPFVFLYFFPGRKRAKRHTYKWKNIIESRNIVLILCYYSSAVHSLPLLSHHHTRHHHHHPHQRYFYQLGLFFLSFH